MPSGAELERKRHERRRKLKEYDMIEQMEKEEEALKEKVKERESPKSFHHHYSMTT